MALEFNPSGYLSAWAVGRKAEEDNAPDFEKITNPLLKGLELIQSGNKAKRDKAAEITLALAEKSNLHPNQIKDVANQFIKTGQLSLPEQAMVGDKLVPVRFGQTKSKQLLSFNQDTGRYEIPEGVPPSGEGYEVNSFSPEKAKLYAAGATTKTQNAKDAKGMSTDDLIKIVSNYTNQLGGIIPGTPEYETASQELIPYREELDARRKRDTVQPPKPVSTKSNGDVLKKKAAKWLADNGAPVTAANIQAVIERGKVQ